MWRNLTDLVNFGVGRVRTLSTLLWYRLIDGCWRPFDWYMQFVIAELQWNAASCICNVVSLYPEDEKTGKASYHAVLTSYPGLSAAKGVSLVWAALVIASLPPLGTCISHFLEDSKSARA